MAIGAVQVAGGYDVAWQFSGTNEYTDSSGNYVSNVVGTVAGNNNALETIETTFHQDLNGDGTIGASAHGSAAVEIAGVKLEAVTFGSSIGTLALDTPSTFSGAIAGFTGNGSLVGSDQMDLRGLNYDAIHSSYDSSSGILAVTDGATTVDLHFAANYVQNSFKFADDGNGGVVVYDQPTPSQPVTTSTAVYQATGISPAGVAVTAGQQAFVFATNFGQVNVANFTPSTDKIHINHPVFASVGAVIAATRDDGNGNAVIGDAAHETIALQHATAAQLLAHQSGFHIV